MTRDTLLTFNAGSSTVKIGLFRVDDGRPHRIARGVIDLRRAPLAFEVERDGSRLAIGIDARPDNDLVGIVSQTLAAIAAHLDIGHVAAAAHRVVHGGDRFAGPVRLDDDAIAAIEALTPLAPLHQPQCLKLIRAVRGIDPALPQAASFDTAFHRTHAPVATRFALPRALHDEGIRRYGFHGLSYRYIAGALAERFPQAAAGKVVAAHLGSGASLCAMDNGVSRDSSMSFTTLDGIPMATRCGAIDPGVLLHLLGPGGRTLAEAEDLLYHRSGLLGVSGISADSRVLLASDRPEAREAIELFTFRIAGEIARLAATLGGLDAMVFTAGIGENQPAVRAEVCRRLEWLGVTLDPAANAANRACISTAASRVGVFVIPTDEEQVIADEACSVIGEVWA